LKVLSGSKSGALHPAPMGDGLGRSSWGKSDEAAGICNDKDFEGLYRTTRKAKFPTWMERRGEFGTLIEPYYPKTGNRCPPVGLERMLRMNSIANGFNPADDACEALYDSPVPRILLDRPGSEQTPDAPTCSISVTFQRSMNWTLLCSPRPENYFRPMT
jgi:hypothetical protein